MTIALALPLALALPIALAGCGGAPNAAEPRAAGAGASTTSSSGFHVVAEGPCGRLSVQGLAGRTFLVYGETGYDLHDWTVGERLAAAQSFVELKGGNAFRVPGLYDGLPTDAGGYVAADLYLGENREEGAWLFAVETRYAARGVGRLFDRRGRTYARRGKTWVPSAESPVALPGAARSLPALPIDAACGKPDLRLVPLASARLDSGEVLVAGRCQDASHVNLRESSLVIAHGSPGATAWKIETAPDATGLDGILNLGLAARAANDAYLVAWEPFKPPEKRNPYLAHWNGERWEVDETGLPEGLMSIATGPDGALYVAAGRALYKQSRRGAPFAAVTLPPLRFASERQPSTLRVHTVRSVGGELWVEGTYRLSLSAPKEPVEARASVLYRLSRTAGDAAMYTPLFCDAREPADRALGAVEGSTR